MLQIGPRIRPQTDVKRAWDDWGWRMANRMVIYNIAGLEGKARKLQGCFSESVSDILQKWEPNLATLGDRPAVAFTLSSSTEVYINFQYEQACLNGNEEEYTKWNGLVLKYETLEDIVGSKESRRTPKSAMTKQKQGKPQKKNQASLECTLPATIVDGLPC
ncbi:hypothetical protein DACRYDRAFT_94579 [Dacryopinax primogenitus]|uniref:Uncharacterized protein n=1 Tax=Dacryopinax primogenitus (strain DJM 731) TaxID=1858805 RepID=M5FW68_DACPD|nr:uncharacterized protein DACRYDRAFT_94579 [Dacryopinax primogenitus]EJU02121.1 hypothetical protein DACRYDRAFT_94579 [Dacryopinax primogenitus]